MQFNQALSPSSQIVMGGSTIALLGERVRYSLRMKAADVTKASKASGLKLPKRVGGSTTQSNITIMCLGPDEWMINAVPDHRARLEASLAKLSKAVLSSITEISHRNMAVTLSGPEAEDVLAVGCPLDLSLTAFPMRRATRSVFENAQILIMRTSEDSFHIEAWRSFTPYLWDFFTAIAAEHEARATAGV